MERNVGKGIAFDPEEQVDDTGDLPGAKDQSKALAPLYDKIERALDKDRPAQAQPVAEQPVAALLADLSPDATDALFRHAHAAHASQLIGARANISVASQNAPKAFADTGSYAGTMPRPEDFTYVFGVEEGRRQLANFDQSLETGKQAFAMRAMPAQDINSQLLDAAVGAANSPDGQSRYRITAAAAQHVLEARQKDPAGAAVKVFPQANEAWRKAAAGGWRDPAAVQNALALTMAAQHYLGVENAQPVPQSVLKELGGLPPQDIQAGMGGLLGGTTDPVVKAAVKTQFAEAGLLGEPARAPSVAALDRGGFDKRFGSFSDAPLAAEGASPSTQAPAQPDETPGADSSPVTADGSQAPEKALEATRPAKERLVGTVRGGAGWTEITGLDGKITRRVGSRNWRNNNPGNIEYGEFARSAGAIGSDGRFAVFPNYETGRAAKSRLLFEGKKYRGATISTAMETYAPRTENDTDGYITAITSALGVDKDTPLGSLSEEQQSTMMDTMQRVEGFRAGTEYIDGTVVSEPVDDNSNPSGDPALPEKMNPPPTRPDVASADSGAAQSDKLSERWVGNSTTNTSLLPEDVQEGVKPYLGALGENFGDGECAALTKEIGHMGRTSTWKKGKKVQGNKTIVPGTPIATFNFDWDDGEGKVHYGPKQQPGGKSGVSHTGIYLGQDDDGIYILDQWNSRNAKGVKVPQKARITRRQWDAMQGHGGLENGSHYYVIER